MKDKDPDVQYMIDMIGKEKTPLTFDGFARFVSFWLLVIGACAVAAWVLSAFVR